MQPHDRTVGRTYIVLEGSKTTNSQIWNYQSGVSSSTYTEDFSVGDVLTVDTIDAYLDTAFDGEYADYVVVSFTDESGRVYEGEDSYTVTADSRITVSVDAPIYGITFVYRDENGEVTELDDSYTLLLNKYWQTYYFNRNPGFGWIVDCADQTRNRVEVTVPYTSGYIQVNGDESIQFKSVFDTTLTVNSMDDPNASASIKLHVLHIPSSIEITGIDSPELIGAIGSSNEFYIGVNPSPASFDEADLFVESSDEKILSIDKENRTYTINGTGEVTITARLGEFSDSVTTTVIQTPDTVSIEEDSIIIDTHDGGKDTYQLTWSYSPNYATNKYFVWSSSDESVATVDQNGLVTAVGEGEATITFKGYEGVSDSCIVTTKIAAQSVGFTYASALLNIEDALALEPISAVMPETAGNREILSYESSDDSVATVTSDGMVTAVGHGSATITVRAADNNAYGEFTVVVPTEEQLGGILVYDRYTDYPDEKYPEYSLSGDDIVVSSDEDDVWRYMILYPEADMVYEYANQYGNGDSLHWCGESLNSYDPTFDRLGTGRGIGYGKSNSQSGVNTTRWPIEGTIFDMIKRFNEKDPLTIDSTKNETRFEDWYVPSSAEAVCVLRSSELPNDFKNIPYWTSSETPRSIRLNCADYITYNLANSDERYSYAEICESEYRVFLVRSI